MFDDTNSLYLIYAVAGLTGIITAEAFYILYAGKKERRVAINRRMKLQDKKLTQEQVLVQLRKERGVDGKKSLFSLASLRRLRTQSGMAMPLPQFLSYCWAFVFALAAFAIFKGVEMGVALLGAMPIAVVLPLFVLKFLRNRRHKQFGIQLPEALDLITRSLKAGHPVPVAIGLVSREMPDPIGTEFGIVADEITYGSDLVTALNNMFQRVGHEDLPLFVTAVSIQSTSGGNLREILDGLSLVIRERSKLRRKIKAIATEGKMSAIILTALPVLLFLGMQVTMPDYYPSVYPYPKTWYLMGAGTLWVSFGNLMMIKMANFKF